MRCALARAHVRHSPIASSLDWPRRAIQIARPPRWRLFVMLSLAHSVAGDHSRSRCPAPLRSRSPASCSLSAADGLRPSPLPRAAPRSRSPALGRPLVRSPRRWPRASLRPSGLRARAAGRARVVLFGSASSPRRRLVSAARAAAAAPPVGPSRGWPRRGLPPGRGPARPSLRGVRARLRGPRARGARAVAAPRLPSGLFIPALLRSAARPCR